MTRLVLDSTRVLVDYLLREAAVDPWDAKRVGGQGDDPGLGGYSFWKPLIAG